MSKTIRKASETLKRVDEKIAETKNQIEKLEKSENLDDFKELKITEDFLSELEFKRNQLADFIEQNQSEAEKLQKRLDIAIEAVKKEYDESVFPFIREVTETINSIREKHEKLYQKLFEKVNRVEKIENEISKITGKEPARIFGVSSKVFNCSHYSLRNEFSNVLKNWDKKAVKV
jgi:predicted RNase H-like nuclease (RuvC/YqgF family)